MFPSTGDGDWRMCAESLSGVQMMADIYQAEIRVPNYLEEATSMGAAILAGIGAEFLKISL